MARSCVVVFRASEACYLGVIRSLAVIDVDVISVVWSWLGAPRFYSDRSTHQGRLVRISNPGSDPDAAREELITLFRELAAEYGALPRLLPTSDSILTFLLNQPELHTYAELANAWDFGTTRRLLNKLELSQELHGSAITQPTTRQCDQDALRDMPLPFVVKPAIKDPINSFYSEFDSAKALLIKSEGDRKAFLEHDIYRRYPLIAQQYIKPNERLDDIPLYLSTDINGKLVHYTSVDKIFVHPAGFGTAFIIREQRQIIPSQNIGENFIATTKLRGIVMLEFIHDGHDNFYFIEANPRPWLLVDYQRLRGRNFFQWLDPTSATTFEPQVSEFVYYVDLTGLCRSFERLSPNNPTTPALKLLQSLDNRFRLSTYDPQDVGPLESELAFLADSYGPTFCRAVCGLMAD